MMKNRDAMTRRDSITCNFAPFEGGNYRRFRLTGFFGRDALGRVRVLQLREIEIVPIA